MEIRMGLIVGFCLTMAVGMECVGSEVLKFHGLDGVGVRSFGKTRFVPEQPSDFAEFERPVAPRIQSPEEDESQAVDEDELPDLGAAQFNLKLLSQQKLTVDSDDGESSKPLELKSSAANSRPKALKKRVLVFKASWCGACQALNYEWPKLEAVKWKVGNDETHHFQIVDADERPDLMSKYGVSSLPTIILVENDQEVARHGLLGAFSLAELYYGRLK